MDERSPKTFQIYSASAGAGKTFNLVKHYLSLCLKESDASSFNRILAITFTVKAASEMKTRVIVGLDAFRRNPVPAKHRGMFDAVKEELQLDEDTLRNRANSVLRRMLHDYAGLGISTIDKFTYRLVRTFGYELGLSVNFDVQLDAKELYRESVDLLLDEYEEGSEVMAFIHGFIESQMEEGKNWRPETKMLEMAEHLGKEDSYHVLDALRQLSLSDFKAIRNELSERRKGILSKRAVLVEAGNALFGHIDKSLFTRGQIISYLNKFSGSDYSEWLPGKEVLKQLEKEVFTKAKPSAEADAAVTPISSQIADWLRSVIAFCDQHLADYALLTTILESFDSLAVLHEISRKLEEYKEANNVETLSSFNKLIHESLRDLPAPYIYERIGEKYRHYFIDEFQDTSILQWSNLTPLVHNAISSGGTSMIVGDAKQSIYRWRGGKAEQFLELIQYAKHPEKSDYPMSYALAFNNLEHNWRSREQIVSFNNDFFTYFKKLFKDPGYSELYSESAQKPQGESDGFVSLEFLGIEKGARSVSDEDMIQATLTRVKECLEEGYSPGDITILIRKSKPAKIMATAFAKEGLNVVSEDSLLLGNASRVRLIVACMRFIHYPNDIENRIEIVDMMHQTGWIPDDAEGYHYALLAATSLSVEDWKKWLSDKGVNLDKAWVEASGLYEKGEAIVRALGLMDEADPFVQFFLDELYDFGSRKGQSIHDFYEWWSEKKEKASISSPKTQDAIQIMTIHKSKGLEFPVVIIPYADFPLFAGGRQVEKRWIILEGEFGGLPAVELPMTKKLNEALGTSFPKYSGEFETYQKEAIFDNLNLLYVAMTRAVDQLHILSTAGGAPKETYSSTGDFIREFALEREMSTEPGARNTYGIKAPVQKVEEQGDTVMNFSSFHTSEWRDRVKLSRDTDGITDQLSSQPRLWGNLIHALMAEVQSEEDVEPAVERFIKAGEIPSSYKESLLKRVDEIVKHPDLSDAFTADEVFAEREWIGEGSIHRPDRVSRRGDTWTVIDYKTGESSKSHHKQVREYMNLLDAEQVHGYLVYMNDEVEVVRVSKDETLPRGGEQLSLL